jgi:hypothetical protein
MYRVSGGSAKGHLVVSSGATKPPAHPEDGDGVGSKTSVNIYILMRLSVWENLIKYFVNFILPSLHIFYKKKTLISKEHRSYIVVDSTHKENRTFTKRMLLIPIYICEDIQRKILHLILPYLQNLLRLYKNAYSFK